MNTNNLLNWANGITKQAAKEESGANVAGGVLGGLAGGGLLGTLGSVTPIMLLGDKKLTSKGELLAALSTIGLGTAGTLYGGIKGYKLGSDLADKI